MKEEKRTNREEAVFETLRSWNPPLPDDGFNDRILQRLAETRVAERKFRWAWAAMIIIVVINVFAAGKIIREAKEYREEIYSTYLQDSRESIIANQINS